jgi:hypothetical protein
VSLPEVAAAEQPQVPLRMGSDGSVQSQGVLQVDPHDSLSPEERLRRQQK